ncbi:MAG: alanine racemase [Bacteroidetes bacterium]|nr:alanine racemase [Bacteroidota bacterium]
MLLSELPTPAVLVDVRRLEANLDAMQAHAEAQQVALRPHTKTHKSVDMARRQVARGARGLTVAKVGEAEVFATAGFQDIRLAYALVGEDKWERVIALSESGCRMGFCVDTGAGARAASDYFHARGLKAEVLIETDIGYGRCGVRWDHAESVRFATWVDGLPGLRVVGILTHAGHAYYGPHSEDESLSQALERVSNQERDRMLEFAVALREAGVRAAVDGSLEISIGSTPSIRAFTNRVHEGFRITEIRPGNYLYLDMTQVNLGVAPLDAVSLTVLATVISAHDHDDGSRRFFLDSGKKVLTSDGAYASKGYGQLLASWQPMTPMSDTIINALSEEHGWVRTTGSHPVTVGERLRVVPNHACVVVNTQRTLFLVDGERVVGTVNVDGQSRVV